MSTLYFYNEEQMNQQVADHMPHVLSIVDQETAYCAAAIDQLQSPVSCISEGFREDENLQISDVYSTQVAMGGQGCSADRCIPVDHFSGSHAQLTRQFWRAGEYEDHPTIRQPSYSSQNRLRVHPKFLHSNASSHKWAFGAIAELLDNAFDEIRNGATFVKVDKITNPRNGSPALLIQDDGGGMDPESLRSCVSFGFSDKESCSAIGQYGNGFKTSTMRLGADAIVFSRCTKRSMSTQSVALLSYTFLRQEGHNDVIVPAVDYSLNSSNGVVTKLPHDGLEKFFSNLSVLLKWSPFLTESELLKNFDDIGYHGTKIIIYNLWFSDMGVMELDFETDEKDIMLSGAPYEVESKSTTVMLTQKHIANTLRYSLRVYSSILYLRAPEYFRVILRGCEVKRHCIAGDLKFCECIKYRPQVGGKVEGEVVVTVGFLKEAPFVNVHGFNIYHRNRLILPFCQVASASGNRGRGVVGVLEADFIKPTHDKQGFERSSLYQKLECRLREITYEYWELYSHLVGYNRKKFSDSRPPSAVVSCPLLPSSECNVKPIPTNHEPSPDARGNTAHRPPGTPAKALYPSTEKSTLRELHTDASSLKGIAIEGGQDELITEREAPLKRQKTCSTAVMVERRNHRPKLGNFSRLGMDKEIKALIEENKELQKQCLQHETTQKELMLKVQRLRRELEQVQHQHHRIAKANEFLVLDGCHQRSVNFEKPLE